MAASIIHKSESEEEDEGRLEFCVGVDKVSSVNGLREQAEQLYQVKITEDIKARESADMMNEKQWFTVLGSMDNCRQAKAYVLASCDPGEVAIFEFDPSLYETLSSRSQKTRIERESNALLMFQEANEGIVIIHGQDGMAVGVAMSLLEKAAYEASIGQMPSHRDSEQQQQQQKMTSETNRRSSVFQSDSSTVDASADSSSVVADQDMEICSIGGEAVVPLDIMKSSDPEIQRLINVSKEKDYSEEEIRDVLKNYPASPTASEFLRALHTRRNLRKKAESETVHDDAGFLRMKTPRDTDFRLGIDASSRKAATFSNQSEASDHIFCWDSVNLECLGQKQEKNKVQRDDVLIGDCEIIGTTSGNIKQDVPKRSDITKIVSSRSDLLNILDVDERKRQNEAKQQTYLEQFSRSSASASPDLGSNKKSTASEVLIQSKSGSNPKMNELDEFSMITVSSESDSGVAVTSSPSAKKRKRKKKKVPTATLR